MAASRESKILKIVLSFVTAAPRSAPIGLRWFEFDSAWWYLAAMRRVGLVTYVVVTPRNRGVYCAFP